MVLVGLSMPSLIKDPAEGAHRRLAAASDLPAVVGAMAPLVGGDASAWAGLPPSAGQLQTELLPAAGPTEGAVVVFSAARQLAASAGGYNSTSGSSTPGRIDAGSLVLHVIVCTILMNVGKLFPAFCYRSEVNFKTRLALAIIIMPRGEVCAGIIVNAIALGVEGPAITIAVLCLAVNMTCVSGFIFAVKALTAHGEGRTGSGELDSVQV